MKNLMHSSSVAIVVACLSLGLALPLAASGSAKPREAAAPKDVIARVGDQSITFGEIETMINSSDMVGMPIPPPGAPERNQVRLMLLDKMVSANLLYLDAVKQGLAENPVYRQDLERVSSAMLAALYREKQEHENLKVTDKEIREYHKKNIVEGTPLTADVRTSIEATIRKERFKARKAATQKKLRQGVEIVIDQAKFDPKGDEKRASSEAVARFGRETVTWGELRAAMTDSTKSGTAGYRSGILDEIIDQRLAAAKARAAGMEKDPVYLARFTEFRKVRLISLYKAKLLPGFEPGEQEIRDYYAKHREKILIQESRKIQMVVLKTKQEADDIKKQIKSGKITLFEAAANHSIDPNAKQTLGEMGWVAKGSGFPDLDRMVFALKIDELGGPVESPAGWHLAKVLDKRDARYHDIKDRETQAQARNLLMHERQNQYVVDLREKKIFPVEVYADKFQRLVDKEAGKIAAKRNKAEKTSSAAPIAEKGSANP